MVHSSLLTLEDASWMYWLMGSRAVAMPCTTTGRNIAAASSLRAPNLPSVPWPPPPHHPPALAPSVAAGPCKSPPHLPLGLVQAQPLVAVAVHNPAHNVGLAGVKLLQLMGTVSSEVHQLLLSSRQHILVQVQVGAGCLGDQPGLVAGAAVLECLINAALGGTRAWATGHGTVWGSRKRGQGQELSC